MSDVIIVAMITGICSVIGQWFISRKDKRESDATRAADRQRVNDRLDTIETKLDEHNGYAEKLGDIQRDIAVLTTEIKNIKEAS